MGSLGTRKFAALLSNQSCETLYRGTLSIRRAKARILRLIFGILFGVATIVWCPWAALAEHLAVTAVPSGTWTKEPGVRIDIGTPQSLDSHRASTPHVIRSPRGMLRMYYAGDAGILSAVSIDGLTWMKEPGIRVSRGLLAYVAHPFVLPMPGAGLRMYYECADGVFFEVCSAASANGLQWVPEPGIRLAHRPAGAPDSRMATDPLVVEIPGGYRMYYHAFDNKTSRILSAVSADGHQWVKEQGARIDAGPPGSSDQLGASHFYILQLPGGRLLMYYAGGKRVDFGDSILSATSTDGLVWTKEPGTRVALGSPGSFDDTAVLEPSILQLPDGRFRMYYVGFQRGTPRILSAVADRVAR